MKTVKITVLVVLFIFAWLYPALADTFSITIPASTETVMGDPRATVPVTLTNNSTSFYISTISFNADTNKYSFSASTVAPAGWCVKSTSASSITFELEQPDGSCTNGSTGSRIEPLQSLGFNLIINPVASTSDSTDTFSSVIVAQSGYTMSGAMPTWTRRSLEAALSAAPSSVGINGTITVTMQVTNRSTLSKSSIVSLPDPPSASSPIVSVAGGPFYASTILTTNLNKPAKTASVLSTTGFPSAGTLTIDSEEICYSGKADVSFTGLTRGCNGTTAANHSSGALLYGMDPFSIPPGETNAVTWTYRADSSGQVNFTGRASDVTGTSSSQTVTSNTVIIGDFTSALSLAPPSATSGQNITVKMVVTNNGSNSLVNVTPSILSGCAGGATETLVSGPLPAFIPSLAPGSSGVFSWTYTVTGIAGQTFCFFGNATADGPIITSSTTTNIGQIGEYSVVPTPSSVSSGSTNVSVNWSVYNGGSCGIREVSIGIPNTSWACSLVTPPAGWQSGCDQSVVTFSSTGAVHDLTAGSTKAFTIRFSSIEAVTGDKVANFPVTLTTRGCGGVRTTIGSYINITYNRLVVTHQPTGPLYADGSSYYNVTATLTSGGTPVVGKRVSFSTTAGTLSPTTAVTGSNGQVSFRLISPNSTINTTATVMVEYLGTNGSDTLNFIGWNKPDIQYWGSLAPTYVLCGNPYTFMMQLKNISPSAMTMGLGSYFSFNDSASGGSSEFKAYIDSQVIISAGAIQNVSFGSTTAAGGGGGVIIPTTILAGSNEPISNSSPPPASGLFLTDGGINDQFRAVTDSIVTSGDCGAVKVKVIEWHEMR